MLIKGLLGQTTIPSASAIAASTPGAGLARSTPSKTIAESFGSQRRRTS
jgi:hypothetical protein